MNELKYPDNLIKSIFEEEKEYSKSGLEEALTTLTEREEEIIRYRFQECKTLREVAKTYNLTVERIRQIEAKALRKLRHPDRVNKIVTVSRDEYKRLEIKYSELQSAYNTLVEAYAEIQGASAENVPAIAKAILNADKPIEDLNLSLRSYNAMKRAGCATVKDISKLTLDELRSIRNMGRKSEQEITAKLYECGLRFADEK